MLIQIYFLIFTSNYNNIFFRLMDLKIKKKSKIIFMGTPDFAVNSLKLLNENYNIVSVVTSPDKPSGRGLKVSKSAVKEFSEIHNLTILQPTNLKDEEFINSIKELNPDLIIVVAFRMLPKEIWQLPKYGTINLHASLLPNYRGAAPINWAIINGETTTGVTTFFINEEIDCGKILFNKEVKIELNDNAQSLHDKLMITGAELLLETVNRIYENNFNAIEQFNLITDKSTLKNAPKIFKENCKINWNMSSIEIYNFIRGLSPYPSSWCEFHTNQELLTFKVFKSEIIKNFNNVSKIISDNKSYIHIGTKDGNAISLLEIQPSSRKKMTIKEFLAGYNENVNLWNIN